MLNPQGEVFIGIVRKIKRKSMTHSGNPIYKIILDNRTLDTKPDGAVNYFLSDSMLDKEYVFLLENGVVIDYRPMPFAPTNRNNHQGVTMQYHQTMSIRSCLPFFIGPLVTMIILFIIADVKLPC